MKDIHITADYVPRPRIDQIFDDAAQGDLVYVIAGAGYGKTQAVRHYIEKQTDAVVRWIQLSENDNVCTRFWETLSHSIQSDNLELSTKLRELGFPDTTTHFNQFLSILKSTEHKSLKTFLVLDDFHLIRNKQVLMFIERCAHLQPTGSCIIIISRKEPEINALSLFSKGQVYTISEDELCFTDQEIISFFKSRGIPLSIKKLPDISDVTKRWVLAIQLLSLVLKRRPDNFDFAVDTMKQNVYKLFEAEAFNEFDEETRKKLVQISLISDLPSTPLHEIFGDNSFIHSIPQLISFVWFDSFIGDYRVHPLYLEFLQSKEDLLSYEEKLNIYQHAANWCFQNNFFLDAMRYFAKTKEYERMLEIILSYPFKLPYDTCEYFFVILEELDPDGEEGENFIVQLLKSFVIPLMLLGMDRYEEAARRSFDVIRKWENSNISFAKNLLCYSYSNLTYIDMYASTVTHRYNAPKYLKKSLEYAKLISIPPLNVRGAFTCVDIRSYACLVGKGAHLKDFDKFLSAAKQTAVYIAKTFHGMYYGYDDLVECEIAFYKNNHEQARNSAYQAIFKAREKKQYGIEIIAAHYLLRLYLKEGDFLSVKDILKQLNGHLDNPDFWNRQIITDLIMGIFYSQIGLPEKAPSWLVMDDNESDEDTKTTDTETKTPDVRIPARELIVSVKCYIASGKYNQALTALSRAFPRSPQEQFAFGELTISLLTVVALYQSGNTEKAIESFNHAFRLSYNGVFEMPFIELGDNMRLLASAVMKQDDSPAGKDKNENRIPADWLKNIVKQASAYAKKVKIIYSEYKMEEKIEDIIQLSHREQEVLCDLYNGLNNDEIAASRHLAVPTIKKVIQSIYIKLGVNKNIDAIRVAIEKNLIEIRKNPS